MPTIDIPSLYALFKAHPFIFTDTRRPLPNSIFFALKGENFDGNLFASKALEMGAVLAVVDKAPDEQDERYLVVENALTVLQHLAAHHRNQLDIPVLGITGSNGKTTTKELVASVISQTYSTFATAGNLNNHIGVPLSLLSISDDHNFAIIEMGANHQKEIEFLCTLARPNHGMITNIGKAHLEGFGGIEGVKKGKKELYDYLALNGGTAFINADDPVLIELSGQVAKKVYYGSAAANDVEGKMTEEFPFLGLNWKKKGENVIHDQPTSLQGAYNFDNILASICVGSYFEVPEEKIVKGVQRYLPMNSRSQAIKTSLNDLTVDYYNANPTSMAASLTSFVSGAAALHQNQTMVIIGDMLELGTEAVPEHAAILSLIDDLNPEKTFLAGPIFYSLRLHHPRFKFFKDTAEIEEFFKKSPVSGYHILLKASRGIKLEKLLPYL